MHTTPNVQLKVISDFEKFSKTINPKSGVDKVNETINITNEYISTGNTFPELVSTVSIPPLQIKTPEELCAMDKIDILKSVDIKNSLPFKKLFDDNFRYSVVIPIPIAQPVTGAGSSIKSSDNLKNYVSNNQVNSSISDDVIKRDSINKKIDKYYKIIEMEYDKISRNIDNLKTQLKLSDIGYKLQKNNGSDYMFIMSAMESFINNNNLREKLMKGIELTA